MNARSMKKTDAMRREYRREDLGSGVRGKYLRRYAAGTNLIRLDEDVAKAFPTSEAVNEALHGLMELARKTPRAVRQGQKRSAT